MAWAIDFEERNDWIGRPIESMSNNQCYALPVCRIITKIPGIIERAKPDDAVAHVSCWQLTEEERQEVARTGLVYVKILGVTLYPMSIHGIKPIYPGNGPLSDVVFTEEQIRKIKGQD